mmetsp:Transcript_11296/g.40063  ORF Transcript_11296/g.40063 Transcript_11296/m.40063 type:complete len:99 (+) Transcript_11296:79-375(+)
MGWFSLGRGWSLCGLPHLQHRASRSAFAAKLSKFADAHLSVLPKLLVFDSLGRSISAKPVACRASVASHASSGPAAVVSKQIIFHPRRLRASVPVSVH